MLAAVVCHSNLAKSFVYNEKKVTKNKAACLAAVNFIQDAGSLSAPDKLARFEQRMSLHPGSECNTVHISLNFSAQDNLSDERMVALTKHYMREIGFERQPYLVYRHGDVYHPHVHVLSTNITQEGKRIQMHEIVTKQSRQVVSDMEEQFSLTRNEKHVEKAAFETEHAQIVIHGEGGTKRAISDVLNTVVPYYNFTSFEEYNAVLSVYNVAAHRGEEGSQLHQSGGLLYYATNEQGQRISKPIKASSFLLKPTLATLEKRYIENLEARATLHHSVDTHADWILKDRNTTWEGFKSGMEQEGIGMVLMPDKATGQENVFFVHHEQKLVLSGEVLGPEYNLRSLQERCVVDQQEVQRQRQRLSHRL